MPSESWKIEQTSRQAATIFLRLDRREVSGSAGTATVCYHVPGPVSSLAPSFSKFVHPQLLGSPPMVQAPASVTWTAVTAQTARLSICAFILEVDCLRSAEHVSFSLGAGAAGKRRGMRLFLVAFCSPAKRLTFSGLLENLLVGKKLKP